MYDGERLEGSLRPAGGQRQPGSATGSGIAGAETKTEKRTGLGVGAGKCARPQCIWRKSGAVKEKRQWWGCRGFLYIARLGDAGRLNRERG